MGLDDAWVVIEILWGLATSPRRLLGAYALSVVVEVGAQQFEIHPQVFSNLSSPVHGMTPCMPHNPYPHQLRHHFP